MGWRECGGRWLELGATWSVVYKPSAVERSGIYEGDSSVVMTPRNGGYKVSAHRVL